MSKTLKIVTGAVVVVALVAVGVWYFVLRSETKETSVDAIRSAQDSGSSSRDRADGTWKVKQDPDVFVGYHIQEIFSPGVAKTTAEGFTPAVEGSMKVSGTTISDVTVKADVTKLKSDKQMRDGAIHRRGLETDKFPDASFTLTSPISLPSAPEKDKEISVTAKGNLTLHGVTKPVEVPLTAKWKGDAITVATVGDGVPIALGDYGIEPISIENFVQIDDHGSLKIELLFVPA